MQATGLKMAESETEYASSNHKLRQGDILKIVSASKSDNAPDLGIIINADCDLENGKIDGTIAYLPIFSFKGYLREFWAPNFVKNTTKNTVSSILDQTGLEKNEAEEVLNLAKNFSQTEIVSRLCTVAAKKTNVQKLTELVDKLLICTDADQEAYNAFKKICATQNNPEKFARKQIDSARDAMGDGHFFISEIVGQEEVGFVVRMQRIFSLPENRVFSSKMLHKTYNEIENRTAYRIAKLTPLYRFKVIQLFSHQFSRVGLPNQISDLSSLAVDDLVAGIVEV
jgi:cellobiose-specific phosphotransferase system component IIA